MRQPPVIKLEAVDRVLLTKAADTKWVKDNPEIFSSDDPNTPMRRAFLAHTLMRKDGDAHMRERMAMAPAYSAKNITGPLDADVRNDRGRVRRGVARRRDGGPLHSFGRPFCGTLSCPIAWPAGGRR